MATLTITIDSENSDNCNIVLNDSDNRRYKIAHALADMILQSTDLKIFLIGAVTRVAETNPQIAWNIVHDICQHQMHSLLANRNSINALRAKVEHQEERLEALTAVK